WFWEAFDRFCDKAGLMPITPQELMQQRMQEIMKAMQQKVPPPRVRKEVPKDKDGAAVPPPADKDAPKDGPAPPAAAPKDAPPAKDKRAADQPPPKGQAAAGSAQAQPVPPPAGIARPRIMRPAMDSVAGMAPDQLVLGDGKPKARPTHYAGSVRIRSLDPAPAQGGQ